MFTKKAIRLGCILFCLMLVLSLLSYRPVEASYQKAAPTSSPYPYLPWGTTYTKPTSFTIIFSFGKVTGATYYRLNVYRKSDSQRMIRNLDISAATACKNEYCQYKTTTYENPMQYGVEYKYKIAAGNSSGLGPNSGYCTFIPQRGINSTFTSGANGWQPLFGTWTVRSDGTYRDVGVGGQYSSVRYDEVFSNFTYEAKVRRNGISGSGFGMIFRGDTSSFTAENLWKSGYVFLISGDNDFIVYRVNPAGTTTTLLPWTRFDGVIYSDWNTLKISANGGRLKFYINGEPVSQLYDETYDSGEVGFIAYGNSAAFYVDNVVLAMPQPTFYFRAPILQPSDCLLDPRGCFSFK
jgi:hypothetical protein